MTRIASRSHFACYYLEAGEVDRIPYQPRDGDMSAMTPCWDEGRCDGLLSVLLTLTSLRISWGDPSIGHYHSPFTHRRPICYMNNTSDVSCPQVVATFRTARTGCIGISGRFPRKVRVFSCYGRSSRLSSMNKTDERHTAPEGSLRAALQTLPAVRRGQGRVHPLLRVGICTKRAESDETDRSGSIPA
jgi:hypothetical protein